MDLLVVVVMAEYGEKRGRKKALLVYICKVHVQNEVKISKS